MWALVFTGSGMHVIGTVLVHGEVGFGAQSGIQLTLCGVVGVFCISPPPATGWTSVLCCNGIPFHHSTNDLHWIPVLFLQSLNKFEHYLTVQRDEWLFWCWCWRKSKCSGREDFQLWQCSRQNGSLIHVHVERAVFTIIYITCNLL